MARRIIPDVVRNQRLVALAPSNHVREAARFMQHRNVGAVLVMEGDKLVGIFTERDMVGRVVADGLDPDITPLSQVMTANPVTVAPNELAPVALRLMDDKGFRHLPVVDNGHVVGIVSRRDFSGIEKAQEEAAQLPDERRITAIR